MAPSKRCATKTVNLRHTSWHVYLAEHSKNGPCYQQEYNNTNYVWVNQNNQCHIPYIEARIQEYRIQCMSDSKKPIDRFICIFQIPLQYYDSTQNLIFSHNNSPVILRIPDVTFPTTTVSSSSINLRIWHRPVWVLDHLPFRKVVQSTTSNDGTTRGETTGG